MPARKRGQRALNTLHQGDKTSTDPVEVLREELLKKTFKKTKKTPNRENGLIKLRSDDGDEKFYRYNCLCPWHDAMELVDTKRSMPLCIEKCANCPNKHYKFATNNDWARVVHSNVQRMNEQLNHFISEKTERGEAKVVKYPVLTLELKMINVASGSILFPPKRWNVKVLKRLWFEKIRTATPAVRTRSQPLNVTSEKFWVELVRDNVYLSIKGLNTERQNQRIPIASIIGATIDSSMQICLAIQSSFLQCLSKNQEVKGIEFEMYVRKQFMKEERFVRADLVLSRNASSCATYTQESKNFGSVDEKNRQCSPARDCDSSNFENEQSNVFPIFSFAFADPAQSNGNYFCNLMPTWTIDPQMREKKVQKRQFEFLDEGDKVPPLKRQRLNDEMRTEKMEEESSSNSPQLSTTPDSQVTTTSESVNPAVGGQSNDQQDMERWLLELALKQLNPLSSAAQQHLVMNNEGNDNIFEEKEEFQSIKKSSKTKPIFVSLKMQIPDAPSWSLQKEHKKTDDSQMVSKSFFETMDKSPFAMMQELKDIECEEKLLGKSLEERHEEMKEKVDLKHFLWQSFLNQWKTWTCQDFFLYLTTIENKKFAKYFNSVDDLSSKWIESEFKGEQLTGIDREDLSTIGVTDKEDRLVIVANLRELLKRDKRE